MSPRLKNILKYLLFVVIGIILVYVAFRNTELDKLTEDLAKARYEYIIISMIMGYVAFISRGVRWKYLIEPLGFKTNTWNAIHAVTIGYLTNFVVPRAGELARCTSLNQTDKVPVNRLFGTVIVERIIDFIMLILLVIITIFLEYNKLSDFFATAFSSEEDSGSWIWKLSLVAIVAGLIIVAYLFRGKLRHLPIYSKAKDFYIGFVDGLRSFNKIEHKGLFIFHTIVIWTMYFAMSYIVVFSLDSTENIDPGSGLFIMIVGALGIIVPSPGGVGSYHGLVMLGMGVIGIAAADALSYATLAHAGQMVMTITTGLISLYALSRIRKRRKARNITELNADGEA